MTVQAVFDLHFFSSSQRELLQVLENHLSTTDRTLLTIHTPNPEQVVQAHADPDFKQVLQGADILLPDGMGIVWASRLLSLMGRTEGSIQQRIAGVDVVAQLLRHAREADLQVLVVGGRNYHQKLLDLPDGVMEMLQVGKGAERLPVQVAHWTPAYKQVQRPTHSEEEALRTTLTTLKPDIVFVCFGAPHQEQWIARYQDTLAAADVGIAMSVGGSFDFLTHTIDRAPKLMQTLGFEWLYRLYQQPWRWRRQLRLVTFIKLTIKAMFT